MLCFKSAAACLGEDCSAVLKYRMSSCSPAAAASHLLVWFIAISKSANLLAPYRARSSSVGALLDLELRVECNLSALGFAQVSDKSYLFANKGEITGGKI